LFFENLNYLAKHASSISFPKNDKKIQKTKLDLFSQIAFLKNFAWINFGDLSICFREINFRQSGKNLLKL